MIGYFGQTIHTSFLLFFNIKTYVHIKIQRKLAELLLYRLLKQTKMTRNGTGQLCTQFCWKDKYTGKNWGGARLTIRTVDFQEGDRPHQESNQKPHPSGADLEYNYSRAWMVSLPWKCPPEKDLPWGGGKRCIYDTDVFQNPGRWSSPTPMFLEWLQVSNVGRNANLFIKKPRPPAWTIEGSLLPAQLEVLSGRHMNVGGCDAPTRTWGGWEAPDSTLQQPEGPRQVTVCRKARSSMASSSGSDS